MKKLILIVSIPLVCTLASCNNSKAENTEEVAVQSNTTSITATTMTDAMHINEEAAIEAVKENLQKECKQCNFSGFTVVWHDEDSYNVEFQHQHQAIAEFKGKNTVQVRFGKDSEGNIYNVIHRMEGNFRLDCGI